MNILIKRIKNHLGSIVHVVNSSGTIIQHYVYSAFGKIVDVVSSTGTSLTNDLPLQTIFAFANSLYEKELDLYHLNLRFYNASTGRFLQSDPHPGYMSLPKTLINKYIYSNNNPVNFKDPSGASWLSDVVDGAFETIGNIGREVTTAINNIVREYGNFLSSEEYRVAIIIVAAFATGGMAGAAAGGGMWGALAGVAVGGLTGAFVGSFHAQLSGDDPQVWLEKGFMIGAVVGGVSGYTKGFGMFESGSEVIADSVSTSQSAINNTLTMDLPKTRCYFAVSATVALSVGAGYIAVRQTRQPLAGLAALVVTGLFLGNKLGVASACGL